ncbi:MAG: AsmA family protein [Rhizobacter sp.]
MSPWIRRTLWALLGLVLVVGGLATWLVLSFDPNRVKSMAVDWMKTQRHRTLVIDGPIQLSVFPRLAVKLSKLSLSEANRADVFASLEEAGLAVDVLPLLHGELVVGRVSAKGVRVSFLRDAQGRSNIDDLIRPEPASGHGDGKSKSGGSQAVRFDISGVDIADLRAHIKDDLTKLDGDLTLAKLTAGHLADGRTAPLAVAARFDFRQPAVKGQFDGETKLSLATATSSVSLTGMNLRFQGDVPGASALDATIQGDLAWNGERKGIEAQSLHLKLAGHAAGLKLADSRIAIDRFAFDPARKALNLRKLQARIQGTQGTHPVALELDWPELAVEGERLGGSAFSGKLSQGGDMPLTATFKSTAPAGSFDAVRLPGFVAQWASQAPQRKLDGTLRADLTLKPAEPSLAFDRLELQARIEEPKLPVYVVATHGSAVASTKRSSWNLQGQLNQAAFATDGTVMLAGVTPQVAAKAHFDALDLNRLLGPPQAAAAPGKPAAGSADTPVDLAALRAVDGQLSLRAGNLAYRQYRVSDVALDAALEGGMLRVTQLQGRAWGGQLNATAFADARASRIAMKGAATGVNVNQLVKDVAARDWIDGNGRVTLDVDTAGRSVAELKSRLKGSAALQVRDGAIKGINLGKVLRQAKSLLGKQDTAVKGDQAEKTDFSELSATFQIADGVARNRDLDLKGPFVRASGEGAIDIGHGRFDYLLRASVVSSGKGQDAADLGALKGVTVPVRLVGPFDAPDWKIEWSAVAASVVTESLKDKVAEKLGIKTPAGAASGTSPKDVLRDKLKGLFK